MRNELGKAQMQGDGKAIRLHGARHLFAGQDYFHDE